MGVKVSIIIPVYNTERYLAECLSSALGQTLHNIEILCINDGSTDSSLKILSDFSQRDSRIKILSKDNSGYGKTMNMGIDYAAGEYLLFLESDDIILPNMCERMANVCDELSLDILKTDYYVFVSHGTKVIKHYMASAAQKMYHIVLNAREHLECFDTAAYTWLGMYRRKFLQDNHIRHNETPGASYQDNGFWFQTTMYCSRFYLLNEAYYMYRIDNPMQSIHNKTNIEAFSREYSFIREMVLREENNDKLRINYLYNIAAHHCFSREFDSFFRIDKSLLPALANILAHDIQQYVNNDLFDIHNLPINTYKRLLVCLASPLRFSAIMLNESNKRKYIHRYLCARENIILYGAGVHAERIMTILCRLNLWVKNIECAVTNPENLSPQFHGLPVKRIYDLVSIKNESTVILCANIDGDNYPQMKRLITDLEFDYVMDSNYIIMNDYFKDYRDWHISF